MKKLLLLGILMLFISIGYSQVSDTVITKDDIEEVVEDKDIDTTRIDFGRYKIILIEEDDDAKLEKRRSKNSSDELKSQHDDGRVDDDDDDDKGGRKSYKPMTNWGGLSFGFHQLLADPNNSPGASDFIDLESGSSMAYEFASVSFPIGSPYISFGTGVGYRRDKYQLSSGYSIESDDKGVYGVNTGQSYEENRVKVSYLEVPLMITISTSLRKRSNLKLSVGYIQKIRVGTKATYEFTNNGKEVEEVVKSDFNFRKFNGVATARVGYRGFTLFADYGLNSVFKDAKGPVLNPLTIGLGIRIVPVIRWRTKYRR